MNRQLRAKLGPHIIEGLGLLEKIEAAGFDIDTTTNWPDAVHVTLPRSCPEDIEEIVRNEESCERLTKFLQARYGCYSICYHEADCKCGYKKKGLVA